MTQTLPLFNAGALRHSVTLQRPSSSSDGAGGRITTYSTVAQIRVAIEPILAGSRALREAVTFGTVRDHPLYRIILRYHTDFTIQPRWRIAWTNSSLWTIPRIFEITAWPTIVDERRRFVELTATEVTEYPADTVS